MTEITTPKTMDIVAAAKKKISEHYQKLRDQLEKSILDSTEENIDDFISLYKNHLSSFEIRCQPKQKAFFHQDERQNSLDKKKDEWKTCKELKENIVKSLKVELLELEKIAIKALDEDYARILQSISERPKEEERSNQKTMRIVADSKKRILEHSEKLKNQLERTVHKSTTGDLTNFISLYKNHLSNFETRCRPKQKAFFHQHERQHSLDKKMDGWQTCKELKENIVKSLEIELPEFEKIAIEAINRDYDRIVKSISKTPKEEPQQGSTTN